MIEEQFKYAIQRKSDKLYYNSLYHKKWTVNINRTVTSINSALKIQDMLFSRDSIKNINEEYLIIQIRIMTEVVGEVQNNEELYSKYYKNINKLFCDFYTKNIYSNMSINNIPYYNKINIISKIIRTLSNEYKFLIKFKNKSMKRSPIISNAVVYSEFDDYYNDVNEIDRVKLNKICKYKKHNNYFLVTNKNDIIALKLMINTPIEYAIDLDNGQWIILPEISKEN